MVSFLVSFERAAMPSTRATDLRSPSPRKPISIALSIVLVLVFSLGAAVGMSSVAGFHIMLSVVGSVDAPWIAVSAGGVVFAFVGYRLAFDQLIWAGSQDLSRRARLGVVTAGFGAFVHRGGTAIDRYVMRATGTDHRESDVRLAALQAMEVAPLAVGACVTALVVLVMGARWGPPIGYSLPWVIGPLVGAPLALWLAARFRTRFQDGQGWRYWIGVALEGVWMLRSPQGPGGAVRRGSPFFGMALFSAGELLALWAGMSAFGYVMSLPALILGYGVGYVLSRRSAPLGGAGVIDVLLILAFTGAGAPLAAAIAGTFTYRFFNLWCTMPASLFALSRVRRFADSQHRATTGPPTGSLQSSQL
jgi:uncharacterized membrane protein YbhN (UPF0104 family)